MIQGGVRRGRERKTSKYTVKHTQLLPIRKVNIKKISHENQLPKHEFTMNEINYAKCLTKIHNKNVQVVYKEKKYFNYIRN